MGYINGNKVLQAVRTQSVPIEIDTGINHPTSDVYALSEKAIVDNFVNKNKIDTGINHPTSDEYVLSEKVVNSALGDKVDKVNGKGLSENDFTDTLKNKLDGIENQANKTIVDSALSDLSENPVQNKVITKELNTQNKNVDELYQLGSSLGSINLWNETFIIANINATTGEPDTGSCLTSKSFIKVKPNTKLAIVGFSGMRIFYYTKNIQTSTNYISYEQPVFSNGYAIITTPANCEYILFRMSSTYGTTYNHDISINYPSTYTSYLAPNVFAIKDYLFETKNIVENSKTGVDAINNALDTLDVNVWNEAWVTGDIVDATGLVVSGDFVVSKDLITVKSGETYFIHTPTGKPVVIYKYASDKSYIGKESKVQENSYYVIPAGTSYIRFRTNNAYGTTIYQNDISFNYPATFTNYFKFRNYDWVKKDKNEMPELYQAEAEKSCVVAQSHEADLRLLVFSDPHNTIQLKWKKYEMLNKEGIFDCLFGLGDYGAWSLTKVPSQVQSDIRNNFKNILRLKNLAFVNGNHDTVPYSTNEGKIKNNTTNEPDQMTYKQLYDLYERHLNTTIKVNPNEPYNPYYFIDMENSKTRIIVLNTSDIYNNGVYNERYANSVIFQQEQMNWFVNTALDFSGKTDASDWSVLVLQHALIEFEDNGSNINMTAYILGKMTKGEDLNYTFNIRRKLVYNSETEEWVRPANSSEMGVKQITINASFSQRTPVKVIGMLLGHDHFDMNHTYKYDTVNNYTFPVIFFGADNDNIYDPYVCFPTNKTLQAGWYKFTSNAVNSTTGQQVTVYFQITAGTIEAKRVMYNDILFKDRTNSPIRIYDENGKTFRSISSMQTTEPSGVDVTELTFTRGRNRTIDSENCYIVSIDKANKKVYINSFGFGYDTELSYN